VLACRVSLSDSPFTYLQSSLFSFPTSPLSTPFPPTSAICLVVSLLQHRASSAFYFLVYLHFRPWLRPEDFFERLASLLTHFRFTCTRFPGTRDRSSTTSGRLRSWSLALTPFTSSPHSLYRSTTTPAILLFSIHPARLIPILHRVLPSAPTSILWCVEDSSIFYTLVCLVHQQPSRVD
jgi:hypothetical protein